jgi:hypothetical protein
VKKLLWLIRVLILGSMLVLLIIPNTIHAGNPVGGTIVISAASEEEVSPAIAYNSQRQEYLVVWYNDRAGCDDIRAQRISKTGGLIGGPFYISAGCPADRRYPHVAYNSAHDQYLVVWEQQDISSGYSIKGRRVVGTGGVLDTSDIDIRSYGGNLYTPATPAVAYASTSDRYLVVWSETWHPMPITWDIYGQVMTSAGVLDGSRFSISHGSDGREQPDLAYNRHANRYLVVWQQKVGTLWEVHGQQVHGGGGLYQSDIAIAQYSFSSTSPVVAAIPTCPSNNKFLVVWGNSSGGTPLLGRLVGEDGTPAVNPVLASLALDKVGRAVAGNESSQQYLVAWPQSFGVMDKPISGQTFNCDGTWGNYVEFSGVAATNPAVAGGPGGDFMVGWQDQPIWATNTNLYGQLWGNRVYIPMIMK